MSQDENINNNKHNQLKKQIKQTMKKLILTAAIVLSMGIGAFAQQGEGALLRSNLRQTRQDPTTPSIPHDFGLSGDENADPAPLGSGIAVLVGLGAAYMVAKKRKED